MKTPDYSKENGIGELFLMGLGVLFLAGLGYATWEGYKIYLALPDMQPRPAPAPPVIQVT